MNYYYDAVLQAVEYIENNLKEDINIQNIVDRVGFSQFHFMRVFKSISGHTINNYLKRRKITEAAKLLLDTDMRIIDIAFLFGYNSQEAFSRVFKEVFNVTPNTYRSGKYAFKNLEQVIISQNVLKMKTETITPIKPKIIYKNDFYIAGMQYKGKNENFEIPKLWNLLHDREKNIQNKINSDICYGFESYDEDFYSSGYFEYVAGVEVSAQENMPHGVTCKRIEGSQYAVFPIPAIVENVPKYIGDIYSIHLPQSGFMVTSNYDFEYYDTNFEANNENSYISLYIPIKS